MSRRIGADLGLKSIGKRDISTKCKLKTPPGEHGGKRKRMLSNYAMQLSAKQMIKYTYGMLERQFKRFCKNASKKHGPTGENLLILLESRLDNVVYRMGFASTRAEARQLVSHRSIYVKNSDKIVSISSYIVQPGDLIGVKDKSKNQIRIKEALIQSKQIGFSKWLDIDIKNMTGVFLRTPVRKELPAEINEQLVIELYSK